MDAAGKGQAEVSYKVQDQLMGLRAGLNIVSVWTLVLKDVKISQIARHSTIMVLRIVHTKPATYIRADSLDLNLKMEESEWQAHVK